MLDRRNDPLYLFPDRDFRDTMPHGVTLPTLVGQPAALAQFEDLIGPFRPEPKPRRRPGWGVVVTCSSLAAAAGYVAGLFAAAIL